MSCNTFIATQTEGITRAVRSEDNTWTVETLLTDQQVHCLCVDPLNSNIVYAGTQKGVFRSDDGGMNWQPAGFQDKPVKAIAASPTISGKVYAGTRPAYLFVSSDGGKNWEELTGFRRIRGRRFWFSPADKPYTGYVQGIALSPTDSELVVIGIEFGAVVISRDAGKTWSNHTPGTLRDCHSLCFHTSNPDWVYECGGTGGGVSFSRDGAQTWQKHKSGLDRHYGWTINADPEQPDIIYASLAPGPFKAHIDGQAEAYIFRSKAGSPWEKLSGGLPQPLHYMPYALLVDAESPGHIYAGLSNGDIWHSSDYGEAWSKMPVNMRGIYHSLIML